jgi:hypothetical protein
MGQRLFERLFPMNGKVLLFLIALLITAVPLTGALGQKKGSPWTEWSEKDAQKILSDSGWSHIQTDTDTSEMFFSPTTAGTATVARSPATRGAIGDQQSINNSRADRGATNQAVSIKYRICFLSAKPVRQAFAKMILSSQHRPDENLAVQLQSFVDRDFSAYIVVAVSVEASDQRFSGPVMQIINSANTGTLKNNTYLERQDGKRLFLISYMAPIQDGLGAKFIFPRSEDGQFFLTAQHESVRFVAEFSPSFKLNMRFKVSDMMFDDKLEY